MGIEIRNIDGIIFDDLFHPCKECIYWECPAKCSKVSSEERTKIKLEWFKEISGVFGTCGKILYVNGKPVAYSQFALPQDIKNIKEYEKGVSPASRDGVIITCLYVREGYRGRGFGQNLLENIIEEIKKKECKTVETYTRDDSNNNPSGPTEFYLNKRFKIIESKKWKNVSFSLLRLNLEFD